MYIKHVIFQSTRPSRASTLAAQSGNWSVWQFQSTRPSRASTQLLQPISQFQKISIHKALAGLDQKLSGRHLAKCLFQSTSPSRASTCCAVWHDNTGLNFNPQGPRGPRRQRHHLPFACTLFQSTRPSRASTASRVRAEMIWRISIHKALAGLDPSLISLPTSWDYFNPQGPRGPRHPLDYPNNFSY